VDIGIDLVAGLGVTFLKLVTFNFDNQTEKTKRAHECGRKMLLTKRNLLALTVLMAFTAISIQAQGQTPPSRTLIVGTKEAPPFAMKNPKGNWTGISIDLWDKIATELDIPFTFKEMDLRGLLDGVANGSLDAAVAALTVTKEREQLFDFSHPYYVTGLGIAVALRNKSPWLAVFKRFFSAKFLGIVVSLIFLLLALSSLIWWFEHKRNPQQFGSSLSEGIRSGFWWSVVTMTTVGYGDKSPVTTGGRVVAIIWMFVAVIIISSFTATITSTLTVSKLESPVHGPNDLPEVIVGTVAQTTSEAYLRDRRLSFSSFETATEGLRSLNEGRIEAFVYDEPMLRYLVNKDFKGDLAVLDTTFERQYYGIALAQGSRLRESINYVLLEKIRATEWQDTLYKYLGK
jgi:ABC-type amino acid transport substrate-binding protein